MWTGCRWPNRRAAIIASQQHPQQLQMKFTPCRTFSPNCTRCGAGRGDDVQRLAGLDGPRDTVAGERRRGSVEREAVVHRGRARAPHVLHLVPAVADARPQWPGPFGPPQSRARGRARAATVPEAAAVSWTNTRPELRVAAREEGLDEVLLDVEVLVEQFGEQRADRCRRAPASGRTRGSRPSAAAARTRRGRRARCRGGSRGRRARRACAASRRAEASRSGWRRRR